MREHVKIRRDYVLLVRARKLEEAQRLLEKMWGRENKGLKIAKRVSEDINKKTKNPVFKENSYDSLDGLIKINGIGKKTIKDIKVMFVSIKALKEALKKDKVALRDDIVEKLKEVLK